MGQIEPKLLIFHNRDFFGKIEGTVMQIEKALINDHLRVSKVFWKFRIPTTLRREIFSWIYFRESLFLNISRGFNFANWLPVDFSRRFIFMNLSFINVLYISIFFYFFFLVCSSSRSMWVTDLLPKFFDVSNSIMWI